MHIAADHIPHGRGGRAEGAICADTAAHLGPSARRRVTMTSSGSGWVVLLMPGRDCVCYRPRAVIVVQFGQNLLQKPSNLGLCELNDPQQELVRDTENVRRSNRTYGQSQL